MTGRPPLGGVCARAGTFPNANAAAVTNATTRDAGLASRGLLGGLDTVISGNVRSLGPPPTLWREQVAVNTRPALFAVEPAPRTRANTAARGRHGTRTGTHFRRTRRRFDAR